jgi:hypothetical protein
VTVSATARKLDDFTTVQWVIDPRWALNSSGHTNAMHLVLKRVAQYSFVPTGRVDAGSALLPLLCGLSY